MEKFKDLICEQVHLCEQGKHPRLLHEFENSFFILGEHQFYKGYSQLILKEHVRELHELSKEHYLGLSHELYLATKAIDLAFSPLKMNHQCIGNQQPHIHWHIIPRYKSDKYHLELPMSDFIKGEEKIDNYKITSEQISEYSHVIKDKLLKILASK